MRVRVPRKLYFRVARIRAGHFATHSIADAKGGLTHPTPSWGKIKNPPNGGLYRFPGGLVFCCKLSHT